MDVSSFVLMISVIVMGSGIGKCDYIADVLSKAVYKYITFLGLYSMHPFFNVRHSIVHNVSA